MIIPPPSVQSFYTLLLTAKPAQTVLQLLIKDVGDIENALVTSTDFGTDVEALVECVESAQRVAGMIGQEADPQIQYNPIYLPNHDDLNDEVEFSPDGDLEAVAGFGNPFVSATLKLSGEELPNFIDAAVCYKQFPLPPLSEFLQTEKVLLS